MQLRGRGLLHGCCYHGAFHQRYPILEERVSHLSFTLHVTAERALLPSPFELRFAIPGLTGKRLHERLQQVDLGGSRGGDAPPCTPAPLSLKPAAWPWQQHYQSGGAERVN